MNEEPQVKSENAIFNYFRNFKVLRETRKEYWGVQFITFLDCTAFFSVFTIAAVMLSDDFGFSDEKAGYVVTLYGATTTICLFFSGMFTDWLGIKRSWLVAMIGLGITRAAVVYAAFQPELPYRNQIVIVAFFLMAPLVAMVHTNYQAANKRFTTSRSRSAGFNMWYIFLNAGAAAGGLLIEIVRNHLAVHNAHIFTFGVFAAAACLIITFTCVRREDQLYGPDEEVDTAARPPVGRKKPHEVAWAVLQKSVFWRFLVLCVLLIGVRAIALYMHLIWPKYWLRVIGPDAAIGYLEMINPILVIVGVIVAIPILNRFSVYKMLVYGAMISALSLFVLAIPSYGNTTYVISFIMLIVLTVGEIIWSPRLNEYTAAIAPEGQEGTYFGLSMVPYFLAKTAVSLLSGHMLTRWIPEGIGDRLKAGTVAFWDSPSALWIILGCCAIVGPVVALLLKGWFTKGANWKDRAAKT